MKRPPILVVGAPRSGMNFAARLLQDMGVCMGHNLENGNYEDQAVASVTRSLAEAKKPIMKKWETAFTKAHAGCKKEWRGYCSTELAFLPFDELNPIWVLRLTRFGDLTQESIAKNMKMKIADATALFQRYEDAIEATLGKMPAISENSNVSVLPLRYRKWADRHMLVVLQQESWPLKLWGK